MPAPPPPIPPHIQPPHLSFQGLKRLLAQQGSDGGFGYFKGCASLPNITAYVLWLLLMLAPTNADLQPLGNQLLGHLKAIRADDGRGWCHESQARHYWYCHGQTVTASVLFFLSEGGCLDFEAEARHLLQPGTLAGLSLWTKAHLLHVAINYGLSDAEALFSAVHGHVVAQRPDGVGTSSFGAFGAWASTEVSALAALAAFKLDRCAEGDGGAPPLPAVPRRPTAVGWPPTAVGSDPSITRNTAGLWDRRVGRGARVPVPLHPIAAP